MHFDQFFLQGEKLRTHEILVHRNCFPGRDNLSITAFELQESWAGETQRAKPILIGGFKIDIPVINHC